MAEKLAVTGQLICAFVSSYANLQKGGFLNFSHGAAYHMLKNLSELLSEAILSYTHNIYVYGKISKIIQLSS